MIAKSYPYVAIGVLVHFLLLFKFILEQSSCHGTDVEIRGQFASTMWVLGIELGSTGLSARALICRAISPALSRLLRQSHLSEADLKHDV